MHSCQYIKSLPLQLQSNKVSLTVPLYICRPIPAISSGEHITISGTDIK